MNYGPISNDGKKIATQLDSNNRFTAELQIRDAASLDILTTIAINNDLQIARVSEFLDGGQVLLGSTWTYEEAGGTDLTFAFVLWSGTTGEEITEFILGENDQFGYEMSPNGDVIAARNSRDAERKLFILRAEDLSLVHTIELGRSPPEQWLNAGPMAFSPDGKWIVACTQVRPHWNDPDAYDLAWDSSQPRFHVINVASGEIVKTLVGPQSNAWSLAYSPDGRYLATGGLGRVLLWDMEKVLDGIDEEAPGCDD